MKLKPLTEEQSQILKLVVEEYYAVLPPAIQVHSLFATHILSNTLHRFGIRTRVLPCRLWCSSLPQNRENVVGFVNYADQEKWNGHVVCVVGDWLVDAALYHLNPAFNYTVPKIIAARVLLPAPGTYARYRLNKETEFIWYRLPAAAAAISLAGYEDYIDRFVNDLYAHLRRLLGYVDETPADPLDGMATDDANDAGVSQPALMSVGDEEQSLAAAESLIEGDTEMGVAPETASDAVSDAEITAEPQMQTEAAPDAVLPAESISPVEEEALPADEIPA